MRETKTLSWSERLAVSLPESGRWHKVLKSEALPPGRLAGAVIAGEKVLLARLDDGTLARNKTSSRRPAASVRRPAAAA